MTTTYHVHLDRVMRLTFWPVRADTPEGAAAIARHLPTDQAVSIDDGGGLTLAARVDPDGGESSVRSWTVDFGGEGRRTAVAMRAALDAFLAADARAAASGDWKREHLDAAFALARAALAGAATPRAESVA